MRANGEGPAGGDVTAGEAPISGYADVVFGYAGDAFGVRGFIQFDRGLTAGDEVAVEEHEKQERERERETEDPAYDCGGFQRSRHRGTAE